MLNAVKSCREKLESEQFAEENILELVVGDEGEQCGDPVETFVTLGFASPCEKLLLIAEEDGLCETGSDVHDIEEAHRPQSNEQCHWLAHPFHVVKIHEVP